MQHGGERSEKTMPMTGIWPPERTLWLLLCVWRYLIKIAPDWGDILIVYLQTHSMVAANLSLSLSLSVARQRLSGLTSMIAAWLPHR